MKTRIIVSIYFIAGIAYALLEDRLQFAPGLVLKGILIPLLILFYVMSIRTRINIPVLAALILSWAGDVAIDFSFIPGLACFLLAHVMYITAFIRVTGKSAIIPRKIYLVIPIIIYGVALVSLLYSNLDGMRIPVIIYAVVILLMVASAMNRLERVNRMSYILVLSGATLFVISDSLIAVRKFGYPFMYSGIAVMITYLMAQYLIIKGIISQDKSVEGE
jgi:uncharacterized membrane protein YhhN